VAEEQALHNSSNHLAIKRKHCYGWILNWEREVFENNYVRELLSAEIITCRGAAFDVTTALCKRGR
jgi:hypothetical protein